jgi:hypothetical protein
LTVRPGGGTVAFALRTVDEASVFILVPGAALALDTPGEEAETVWATARFGPSEPWSAAFFPLVFFAMRLHLSPFA